MDIRASSTISQCLAKAFKANSKATSPPIPEYLKEFTSIFSKKSFDILPESKEWDHAIEIIPGSKASNCKVYPLSPSEQKELDAFLKEQGTSALPNLQWHLQSSSLRRRMALSDLYRTTKHWMRSQWKTSTPFPSSLNSLTNFRVLSISLNLMSARGLIMSAWKRETSWKQPSRQIVVSMNP